MANQAGHDPHWALAYATLRQAEAIEELALQVAHLGWTYGHGTPGAAQHLALAMTMAANVIAGTRRELKAGGKP